MDINKYALQTKRKSQATLLHRMRHQADHMRKLPVNKWKGVNQRSCTHTDRTSERVCKRWNRPFDGKPEQRESREREQTQTTTLHLDVVQPGQPSGM